MWAFRSSACFSFNVSQVFDVFDVLMVKNFISELFIDSTKKCLLTFLLPPCRSLFADFLRVSKYPTLWYLIVNILLLLPFHLEFLLLIFLA